ncbi:MAG: type I-G CRISPR-associated protein Csb2 [Acidimicrobiales bacterium]
MTTDIVLRFPWGRYHGTPWGRHVNEGAIDWPPSSWRLLRALYATWQFRAPELDIVVVESLLGRLAGPPSYSLPSFTTAATRHFLPGKDHFEGVSSERNLAVDAFTVVAPGAEVRVRWDVQLTAGERQALDVLLRQLTYLGRAESLCDAHVSDTTLPEGPLAVRPLAHESGDPAIDILVPTTPLDIGALTASTTRVRAGDRRRLPAGARPVRYVRPEVALPISGREAIQVGTVKAVRWSLAGRALPSRHAAVALCTRLRQGAMRAVGAGGRPTPPVLHGKYETLAGGTPQTGHGHAHWLAFGDPDGRPLLSTVVAWAPDGFDAEVLAGLAGMDRVRPGGIPDFGPQRLGLEGWGDIDDVAPELVGPSRVWRSFTPFAPNGHRKEKEVAEEDYLLAALRRELSWRGAAPPASIEIDQRPWRAYRTHRPDKEWLRDSRRVWGLSRLAFDDEVSGPMVLGALSHFGLGLFLPEH